MKDELLKVSVIEKFEIERVYWERQQIDWGILTELENPKEMARNISYILDYYNLERTTS
ncbi:TnsA endonuclease N-terminal domain-containing protein [Macrococcoides caseolyticum]|uniref:TnsA endonuclease N-terminal domain-containing protein n=1 Tax=Macrococcoides caseolyticum TaxID=69966 RepID=UPI001E51B8A5|nr:TnsA endonuclease N-terminal domain-containing protein [Macrococcus caseolyticus]